ncbi:hypothetical protein UFOVP265_28 [uncultured Caudovirales phage]|uniref:Uncharacterized protein n=1 Tax=uncultured Caudovirales phage TaxID=2100421 RepID=A0A6J5LID2_9CAUD|nr:hypothetical protein UFOVP265_28 [uncultured Caudovirales phage]
MNYPKDIIRFANDLASNYENYSDIPDFELYELSSLLMSLDYGESVGSDNPQFATKMFPSLQNYMRDITNKDNQIEFIHCWREGIKDYYYNTMQDLFYSRKDINYPEQKEYISIDNRTWVL